MKKKKFAYIISETTVSGGEKINPDELYSEYSNTIRHTVYNYISEYEPTDQFFFFKQSVHDSSIFKEKEVYLGIVSYHDGNTFGIVKGNHHICGIYKTEARAWSAVNTTINHSYDYSLPWHSYFAGVDETLVIKVPIKYYHIL